MGFVIDLASSISGLPAGYQQAIDTAIDFFEATITTNMTVTLNFNLSALGSSGAVGESDGTRALDNGGLERGMPHRLRLRLRS